jgi:hypothetical protein
MDSIAFIDIEVSLKNQEILDIGGIKDVGDDDQNIFTFRGADSVCITL